MTPLDLVNVRRMTKMVSDTIADLLSDDKYVSASDSKQVVASINSYLESLKEQKCLDDSRVGSVYEVVGWSIGKQGRVVQDIKCVYDGTAVCDGPIEVRPFRDRRTGPHRPRRLLRRMMRRTIGNQYIDLYVRPIQPIKQIQIQLTVTPQGTSFDEGRHEYAQQQEVE